MIEQASYLLGVDDYSEVDKENIKATAGKPQEVLPYLVKKWENLGLAYGDLYLFNGKCYEPLDQVYIDRLIYNFYLKMELKSKFNLNRAKELIYSMKHYWEVRDLELDKEENLINLENGVFNLDTYELYPHSRDYQFSYTLDVSYDPTQTACPTFEKFIQGLFATGGTFEEGYDYDVNEVENILRMCGYLIYPRNRIDGMFILLGEGSNGKSVLIDVIKGFFPQKYVTSLSLGTISNPDSFGRESLMRSKINICSEEKGGQIDSEELKRIISGDQISIQRKFQNGASELTPRTKIAVAVNNMPYFNDTTFGTIRRLIMFHFRNRFLSETDYNNAYDPTKFRIFKRVDKYWLERELKKEKSAIFNQFLEGLKRLKKEDWEFVPTESSKSILEDYKIVSDVLGTWLRDNYEVGTTKDFVKSMDVYSEFCDFYLQNYGKRTTHSTASLGKRIKEQFRIDREQKYLDGGRAYGYVLRKRDPGMEMLGEAEEYEDIPPFNK